MGAQPNVSIAILFFEYCPVQETVIVVDAPFRPAPLALNLMVPAVGAFDREPGRT